MARIPPPLSALGVDLLRPGQTVALLVGRDRHRLTDMIPRHLPLTAVVTNSIRVATDLGRHHAPALLIPGSLSPRGLIGGAMAGDLTSDLDIDTAFLAAHLDPEGASTTDLAEAETIRAILERSRRVVAVTTTSGWDPRALAPLIDLDAIDAISAPVRTQQGTCRLDSHRRKRSAARPIRDPRAPVPVRTSSRARDVIGR